MARPEVFVAIPLMNEPDFPETLLHDLAEQRDCSFRVVVCVNQPDHWWELPQKHPVCLVNRDTLARLSAFRGLPVEVIDRSSPGLGWKGKNYGVGWARKTVMDRCARLAGNDDLMVSLDGDTRVGTAYLASVRENLLQHPGAVALAVPYYHRLTGEESADRAILRYEIYMRYYALNLWRIGSPYRFTALGSAMALPVAAYRAIRGMTPKLSGEDFYFLQKLRKYGEMLYWNPEKVYPAARFSDRVFFGTGPAMIRGRQGDWSGHPLYQAGHFDEIALTYSLFPRLYEGHAGTPMDDFLRKIFREDDPWTPLRRNHPGRDRFIRACHEKVDGLRMLQYLKSRNMAGNSLDVANLSNILHGAGAFDLVAELDAPGFTFDAAETVLLNRIRDRLAAEEEQWQTRHYACFPKK